MRLFLALLAVAVVALLAVLSRGGGEASGVAGVARGDVVEVRDQVGGGLSVTTVPGFDGARVAAEAVVTDKLGGSALFGLLIVHVVDGDGAVAGASVHVPPNVAVGFVGVLDEAGVARTDEQGIARFRVRPGKTAMVTVGARGSKWTSNDAFMTPEAGDASDVTVTIAESREHAPVVISVRSFPYLAPIEGALVTMSVGSHRGYRGEHESRTGEDGRVEVPWREGVHYVVTADGHGFMHLDQRTTAGAAAEGALLYADLKRNARLHGRLVFDGGVVPSGARVDLNAPPRASTLGTNDSVTIGSVESTPFGETVTSAVVGKDGEWAIEGIDFPGRQQFRRELTVVVVVDGASRPLIRDLALRPGDDILVVDEWEGMPSWTITFRYETGRPLAEGTPFHLLDPNRDGQRKSVMVASASLDGEGRVRLDHVPPGTWAYSHWRADWAARDVDGQVVHDGSGETVVVTEGFDVVMGRLEVGGDGRSLVPGGVVVLRRVDGRGLEREEFVGSDGIFRFDNVPVDVDFVVVGSTSDQWLARARSGVESSPPFDPRSQQLIQAGAVDVALRVGQ